MKWFDSVEDFNIKENPDSDEMTKLIFNEFNQAWLHFRHFQLIENQLIAFSFTLLGATIFGLYQIIEQHQSQTINIIAISSTTILFNILYLRSVKTSYLTKHYKDVIQICRKLIYKNEFLNMYRFLDISQKKDKLLAMNIFKISWITQKSILLIILSLSIYNLSEICSLLSINSKWYFYLFYSIPLMSILHPFILSFKSIYSTNFK